MLAWQALLYLPIGKTHTMIFFLSGYQPVYSSCALECAPLTGIQLMILVQLQLPRYRITVRNVAWSPCPFLRLELLGILEISLHWNKNS